MESITHADSLSDPLFTVEYAWTLDNNVAERTEIDCLAETTAVTTFDYDHCDRRASQ